MEPDGKTPGKYKRAYDVFGLLATQIGFSYTVAPFIILDFKKSLILWGRVKVSEVALICPMGRYLTVFSFYFIVLCSYWHPPLSAILQFTWKSLA